MSHGVHAHGHAHEHSLTEPIVEYNDPQFGKASPGKIAMWLFLMTDGMSFSGLLLAYAVVRALKNWPTPSDHLGIVLSGVATFILICSSVSMVFSIDACKHKHREQMLRWLSLTILGGAMFLVIQAYEYTHLIHEGITLTKFKDGTFGSPLFASTFFMITGFHGLHVFSGVVYLICMFREAYRGDFDNGNINRLEIAGLFWHFVDLVWILVFTFIYLV